MVQAILEGRKSMTRRIVKPQPENLQVKLPMEVDKFNRLLKQFMKKGYKRIDSNMGGYAILDCPYGQPGDLLWVKETYALIPSNYICYKASNINITVKCWKPSIYMPRIYSRMLLKVLNIRVERLQQISSDDARKEGVKEEDSVMGDFRPGFLKIWDKIHGPESWNDNPWVWVVEFEMVNKD